MACACIRKAGFDLDVAYHDCKSIVLVDMSQWVGAEGYAIPDKYPVAVLFPNGVSATVLVNTGAKTLITSQQLLGTTEPHCIPDGLICFKTSSCGMEQTINRAYLCNTQCQIDTIRSRGRREEDFKESAEFQEMLDAIQINVSRGKVKQAEDLLTLLRKRMEKYNCDCGCV